MFAINRITRAGGRRGYPGYGDHFLRSRLCFWPRSVRCQRGWCPGWDRSTNGLEPTMRVHDSLQLVYVAHRYSQATFPFVGIGRLRCRALELDGHQGARSCLPVSWSSFVIPTKKDIRYVVRCHRAICRSPAKSTPLLCAGRDHHLLTVGGFPFGSHRGTIFLFINCTTISF